MEVSKVMLIDELCKFNNCSPNNLAFNIRKNKLQNTDFIRTFGPFYTTHTEQPHRIEASNFSNYPANLLYVFGTHRSRTTVEQYYLIKYGISLQYPNMPCLIVNGGWKVGENARHLSFFPLECLYMDKRDEEVKKLSNELQKI